MLLYFSEALGYVIIHNIMRCGEMSFTSVVVEEPLQNIG